MESAKSADVTTFYHLEKTRKKQGSFKKIKVDGLNDAIGKKTNCHLSRKIHVQI